MTVVWRWWKNKNAIKMLKSKGEEMIHQNLINKALENFTERQWETEQFFKWDIGSSLK